jgi:hypothetical protein
MSLLEPFFAITSKSKGTMSAISAIDRYRSVIQEIGDLNWSALTRSDLMAVCCAYYYFSVQFVEAVHIACELYPRDPKLGELREGECDTDNLSPYPGIATAGEKMNHDEFMRRVVAMSSLGRHEQDRVDDLGRSYLAKVHGMPPLVRAMSLSSYEDGGLETVFRAMLSAPDWNEPSLAAFRHFLVEHIRLDSGESGGHGSLCRHLAPDDRILPLWEAFRDLLVQAAPRLSTGFNGREVLSLKATILNEIRTVAAEHGKICPPLTDDLALHDSGLDSLCFAILVVRLEDITGCDPLGSGEESRFPRTIGEFIALYEQALA